MGATYFDRIVKQTPTRLWVNNPSRAETDLALANHCIHCTTNPAFCSKLLESDPEWLHEAIDAVIRETDDDDVAADLAYQRTAGWIIQRFRPLYDRSNGALGYVTVQADPREDEDADLIVKAALRHCNLGPNYMAKIPVTEAGMEAIEALVARNIAITATEMFSVDQTTAMCERYLAAVKATGNQPVFFITHITGIFDEFIAGIAKKEKMPLSADAVKWAGTIVARKVYRLVLDRGYPTTVLLGGARWKEHFTEFVGGAIHATLNWSTIRELIELDLPVISRIDTPADAELVAELDAKLPHFHRAYHADALPAAHFKNYGPLVHFRNNFVAGYTRLLEEVAARRRLLG